MPLYQINEEDRKEYVGVLVDYYRFYRHLAEEEALKKAEEGYERLIRGYDLDGNPLENKWFDDRLKKATHNFYSPSAQKRYRYKYEKEKTSGRPKIRTKSTVSYDKIDEKELKEVKKTLLYEYPFLANRKDLSDTIYNYCCISLKVKKLLGADIDEKNNMGIKSLIDAQISLGKYLGISEADRQKQKLLEDQDNIASLSLQFQETVNELPEILEEFKFFELRMLLNKYERKEISRTLFQLDSYAGMTVEEAYMFVDQNKAKYEPSTAN